MMVCIRGTKLFQIEVAKDLHAQYYDKRKA
jgi:hypothetical protein